jgi:CRISPR/Cas system-associated exonuclease Cas4 (RecB family)
MAKPRVFISSSFYDLKELRSALERFVENYGFEPILSEKGKIAYSPDIPLDESCYREVQHADILILIVGGRYGAERSKGNSTSKSSEKKFFDRYESITREEFRAAVRSKIPIYVFIERAVYSEYYTYLKNKGRQDIQYAHVDSENIFHMIEEIMSLPRNNPVFPFDRCQEIESLLKEQWASLFGEFLHRLSNQEQLKSLGLQIEQLQETNETFKKYFEAVMTRKPVTESRTLIDEESKRLEDARINIALKENDFIRFCMGNDIDFQEIKSLLYDANSIDKLFDSIEDHIKSSTAKTIFKQMKSERVEYAEQYINDARKIANLPPLSWDQKKTKR